MKNIDIGFWEVLLLCLTVIVVVGMVTGHNVDIGGDGCVHVYREK